MNTPTITGIWGAPGTIKSTLAATWPMGIGWHEFDLGDFERGSAFLDAEQAKGVTLHQYPTPVRLSMEKDGHLLEGWIELWQDFLANLKADLAKPNIETVVYGTGHWQPCHRAYLQLLQRKSPNRESLIQIEYGDVNPWMSAAMQAPRAAGKNLVVIMHDTPYYIDDGKGGTKEDPNGSSHPAEWSHFSKRADLMLHTTVKDKVPHIVFEDHNNPRIKDVKTGMAPLELTRMELANPTYDSIMGIINAAKALQRNGDEIPTDADMIVATAKLKGLI